MLDREFIGTESEEEIFEVEKGAIGRFAEAIGDPSPIYFDGKKAKEQGYPGIVAPLTFPTTFRPSKDIRAPLGIDMKNVLHGEQEYTFLRPICAGELIRCKTMISDIYEKTGKSGTMDFLVAETVGRDESGAEVFRARAVTVVRR